MASVMSHGSQHPMRQMNNDFMAPPAFHANKEAEWSQVRDNVLDEYLAGEDVFGFGSWSHERSSSDDSQAAGFGYSLSSGQSNQTTGTSPDPTWVEQVAAAASMLENPMNIPILAADECAIIETPSTSPGRLTATTSVQSSQPQSFWEKAVSRLERGAKVTSRKERLHTSKSHPDFLSLGGYPSPASAPVVPQLPIVPVPNHTLSLPRTRGRETANGKKRATSQHRSMSRGRPQGVAKHANNNGNVSPRKASMSPTKMMNPSRYRAGVQEVLAGSPMKAAVHHQSLPPPPPAPSLQLQQQLAARHQRSSFPASPPSSAQLPQQNFTAFGASPMQVPVPAFANGYDNELSPLTSTFQQARLVTPEASPFFVQGGQTQSYFDPALQTNYTTVPLNDVQAGSALATNRIGSFDFGFNDPAPNVWPTTTFDQPSMQALTVPAQEVFAGVHHPTLQQLEQAAGLGITCDATAFNQDFMAMPNAMYNLQPVQQQMKACYPPLPQMPSTPSKQRHSSSFRADSPSPPGTDSRSRRASGSHARRVSKHRRTKSTTSLPRTAQAQPSGFVNFTPDDSGKILSGVAPSGSSKTKARREKEAADRRRRLSQAAYKAVIDAGGNAEDLFKAGLDPDS